MASVEEVGRGGGAAEHGVRGDTIFGSRVGSEGRLLGGGQDPAGERGERGGGGSTQI